MVQMFWGGGQHHVASPRAPTGTLLSRGFLCPPMYKKYTLSSPITLKKMQFADVGLTLVGTFSDLSQKL